MKKLILFFLLIPWFCFAQSNMVQITFASASGPTILVGTETIYATGPALVAGNKVYGDKNGFTAVASGSISKGYVYSGGNNTATTFKMLVYDSSFNLIVESAPVAAANWVIDTLTEFTFSSGAIVSGNKYYLDVIADSYFRLYHDNVLFNMTDDATGNYTNPPDPFDPTDTTGLGRPAGMYLTD